MKLKLLRVLVLGIWDLSCNREDSRMIVGQRLSVVMRQFWQLVITDLFDDLRSFIFAFLVRSQYILSMTRMAHPISISFHPRGRRSRSTRRERPRPPPRSPRSPCRKETASHAILPITKQTRLGGSLSGSKGAQWVGVGVREVATHFTVWGGKVL